MQRPSCRLRLALALLGVLALLLAAGCTDSARQSYATEGDEPYYKQGEQMKRANRHQEALSAYLKVIEKRGDDAPESHLEAGLIYLHHIRDPIAAIYHFRKFLALRPNSAQAALVRQRIDAAMRDFARTLPAQPIESQVQRVDLIAALDKLKLENDLLKQQLAEFQAGRVPAEVITNDAGASASNPLNLSLDPLPTVRTRPNPTASTNRASAPTTPPRPSSPPSVTAQKQTPQTQTQAPARTAGRRHTVRAGDTLSKLAQEYYGNRARWRDIYQANRSIMRNESDLKVGMELVIP